MKSVIPVTTLEIKTACSQCNLRELCLPFGLDPETTPVLGSYRRGPQVAAELTSAWYRLPARSPKDSLGLRGYFIRKRRALCKNSIERASVCFI